jgi:uncharacterized protein (TIGR02246 family)
MKSMRLIAPVLVAVCLLVVPLAWSQAGNADQQIKKLTDQIIAAQLKADTNSYEKLLADDYTAIRGDGTLSTKAQEIENFKSGAVKYETADVRNSKIRVYGDTAVVTSLLFFKGTTSGKPFSGDVRSTRVWVKQKGNWKCVAFQVTRVASASK